MRWLTTLAAAGILAAGGYWLYYNHEWIGSYVENSDFLTLEARYSSDQIMNANRNELLVDEQHTYQEPTLKFYPYLLMEVKYTQGDRNTREGVVLWGMVDGEMVINADTWEKTHGFEDAISANATTNDFKVLNALAKGNGALTRDQLQKALHVEQETLEPWIQAAKDKRLIVIRGNLVQLHFQNPKILVSPQTKITQSLVTKPYNHAQRVAKKYSKSEIVRTAEAAFGNDFTVRNAREVFLPVYNIEVLNPDGSILTRSFNALNGRAITPRYLDQGP